jgi:hypothetical protein
MQRMTRLICGAAVCLAVQGLGLLSLAGDAAGQPSVSFKALFVPISGAPKTGNILGAGAALQTEYTISGSEYGGVAPPLIGLNLFLPSKTKVHSAGFPSCPRTTLESAGASGCPKGSLAGPAGSGTAFAPLIGEWIEEQLAIQPFYEPGGRIGVWFSGNSPFFLSFFAEEGFLNLHGAGGFGPSLKGTVPLVEDLPGERFISVRTIHLKLGSALTAGKKAKAVYLMTVPKKCATGGFKLRSEATFAQEGQETQPITVTSDSAAPCPK